MEVKKVEVFIKGAVKKLSIGSGPVIIENNKVLLVRGKGGVDFKFPGGHMMSNESWMQAAVREAKEEIGCEIKVSGEPVFYLVSIDDLNLDILLVHYAGKIVSGNPVPTTEIEEIGWFDVDNLPENIMENVKVVVEKLKI